MCIRDRYEASTDERMKEKYKSLIKEVVIPSMDEMLICIEEQYGENALKSLETIIKEMTHG